MPDKPHIIIFNPDEWRGDVLGHVGNPAAVTPNLDRLASGEGVSFSNAFCQNPVCTPSRCSFMSGWYPHVRGHRTMYHMLHPEHGEPNLLKILKQNGYFVWWGGKNDLVPGQSGDTDYCDVRFWPSSEDYARWGCAPHEGRYGSQDPWRGPPESDNFYSFYKGKLEKGDAEFCCDGDWAMLLGALDFIRDYRGDQPLCLYLPLGAPHPPYAVEDPWHGITDRTKLPPRARFPENGAGKPEILKGLRAGQHLEGWSEERWSELRATYYGMCSRLDHQFGRLMNGLQDAGLYDDAAVFVFSDHGDFAGDYGLVEKTQNTFEDCLTRVPLLFKPPAGTPLQPGVRDALVELIDFTATVYDLTGIHPGYDHFGKSLLPLVAGASDEHRDAVFCEGGRRYGEIQAMERESQSAGSATGLYSPRMRLQTTDDKPYHGKATMCRTRRHKYVCRLYEKDELYDLAADPREERNCIDDPGMQSMVAALRERLLRWSVETADVVPQEIDKR